MTFHSTNTSNKMKMLRFINNQIHKYLHSAVHFLVSAIKYLRDKQQKILQIKHITYIIEINR